jgi:two-component system, sensor histidine kinase LadS
MNAIAHRSRCCTLPLPPAGHTWWVVLAWLVALSALLSWSTAARAEPAESTDLTLQSRFWVDTTGKADIYEVAKMNSEAFQLIESHRSFKLATGSLWMRVDLPALDKEHRWYLSLDASAFTDLAVFYQENASGNWKEQKAGDHVPVAEWSVPARAPTFAIDPNTTPGTAWLRIENYPAPVSPRLSLINGSEMKIQGDWTTLLIGAYIGFVLLVMFLGWVHARLYADRAFAAYVLYVASMLAFQVAFTGFGGAFFWGHWAWWNNAAPALFMLWLTASGIWFVREACSLSRHNSIVDRVAVTWSQFGFAFSAVYALAANETTFLILNLYGLLSVMMSIALCFWAWRQGERYAGWLLLGFLPVHLGYPFPALRSAGILPDSWASQYAVLIGSAIEIPLLLYIMHRRAKDFSENRARMRALDSTDPLTGLTITPILRLRLRDAMRRAKRNGHLCGLLLVEVSNHSEIVSLEGREGGDRALVVAASKLTRVVRDVDTVCRVSNTRFAVLVEGPVRPDQIKLLAQHFVAKGLERTSILPADTGLRFRMVTAMLPMPSPTQSELENEEWNEHQILKQLDTALDELGVDTRRAVQHLPQGFVRDRAPGSQGT